MKRAKYRNGMEQNKERITLENIRLQYARWEDLPSDVQTTFASWLGGKLEEGRDFFRHYFYWYNVAREVAFVLRTSYGSTSADVWEEENAMNQFAAAYWRAKGQSMRLLQLEKKLRVILSNLPDPVPPDYDRQTFFRRRYREISADPVVFGHFQFSFALVNLQQPMEFPVALRELISAAASEGNTIPLSPDIPMEETLPYFTVEDIGKTVNAYGLTLPEIQVVCAYSPALQFVQWDA